MKLSKVTLYYNTPMVDFNNTVHYDNTTQYKNWLDNTFVKKEFEKDFNLVRDRLTINTPIPYADTEGVNYGCFIDGFTGKPHFFYVMTTQYINDKVTSLQIVIDVMASFTQGNVLENIQNVTIQRQHLPRAEYNNRLQELRTNSDILKTTTKKYVHSKSVIWKELMCVFQCSVDLEAEFGTENKPKIKLSKGVKYDKIVSPIGLYAIELDDFKNFSNDLSDFPWIGQNIKSVILIPKSFIDTQDLSSAKFNGKTHDHLKKFVNGGNSQNQLVSGFSWTPEQILGYLGFPTDEKHLLRNEYATLEVYNWTGQNMDLDLGFLPETGLNFQMVTSIGYANQISIFPVNWMASGDKDEGQVAKGTFLNNSLTYNNWTEVPVLTDNYKLGLANNANKRAYAESQLLTGRVKNIKNTLADDSMNVVEKATNVFTDAYALLGGGLNPLTIGSKIADEQNFYRQQKAEFADMALTSPSLSNQSGGEAFSIANDLMGFTVKLSAPSHAEVNKIRRYYKTFGYAFEEQGKVQPLHSMTVVNYLQMDGVYTIPNIAPQFMQQIKALLQIGVKFWHNPNNVKNPFSQDILENKIRI
jgi:hypothetical protein